MIHPTVRIIGVEDMKALEAHSRQLDENAKAEEQWTKDFTKLLKDDMGSLRVTASQAKRFETALDEFLKTHDFQKLAPSLYDVVGSNASLRGKIKDLADRYAATSRVDKIAAGIIPSTDDPLFLARDKALVSSSVRAAKNDRVISLVMGKAHLYGVETLMRQQNISFISVVPLGVDDESQTKIPQGMTEEEWGKQLEQEASVYENWRKGTAADEIEQYLNNLRAKRSGLLKPPPASGRPDFQSTNILMSLPVAVEELIHRGKSTAEIRNVLRPYEDAGFKVLEWYALTDGVEVSVENNGAKFWVILTSSGRTIPPGYNRIGSKPLGERQLVLCDAGGTANARPPLPPANVAPPWSNPDFGNSKQMVIFREDGGAMWRYIGSAARPLQVNRKVLAELTEQFDSATPGPEKTLAAQRLSDVIFANIEDDLPRGERAILHTSQNDVLKAHTLIELASFAGGYDYPTIRNLVEDRVVRWMDFQNPSLRSALTRPSAKVQRKNMAIWLTKDLDRCRV